MLCIRAPRPGAAHTIDTVYTSFIHTIRTYQTNSYHTNFIYIYIHIYTHIHIHIHTHIYTYIYAHSSLSALSLFCRAPLDTTKDRISPSSFISSFPHAGTSSSWLCTGNTDGSSLTFTFSCAGSHFPLSLAKIFLKKLSAFIEELRSSISALLSSNSFFPQVRWRGNV